VPHFYFLYTGQDRKLSLHSYTSDLSILSLRVLRPCLLLISDMWFS
jgi:hypothetical protein